MDDFMAPELSPAQSDLLARGRAAYDPRRGVYRVIWQASCGFGKTWVAAEQTRRAVGNGKRVLHVVHRRRLVDQMLGTLGRFGVSASPLMRGRAHWNAPAVCASRDTLLAMLKDGNPLPTPDLIVWDECHTAAHALTDFYLRACPAAFWTGHTATPVGADGRSLAPPYQALVCSAPTPDMIRAGRLCPVRVYNPDAVGRRRRRGEKVKPTGDPVAHWKRYGEDSPTVAFCSTVAQSLELVGRYRAAGVSAEHIDASTPDDVRDAVFGRSESGETKVISNVGVMVEGVDLPWLRCCQILRGCDSIVLWFQANGRIMRASAGKADAICLDHAGAAHEFGLPDAATTWILADEEAVAKLNRPPKDRRPVTCLGCGLIFPPGPACPGCGRVLPRKRRAALGAGAGEDGLLTRFEGQARDINRDRMERAFRKAYYVARAKGWPMAMAATLFRREFGIPPWEAGLAVDLPFGSAAWRTPAKDWHMESTVSE